MADNIKIEERVLDGDFVGPVTTEIDTKDFTGTVGLENSLLDGSGSEINIELSESMEVVGIDDLVEVKSEIDKSVNKAEASVEESQRQIDKANETIRNLDAISGQITNLVDTAKQAATAADNHAHDAQASETNAANSASEALSSQKAAKSSEKAAKTSQAAAKDSENKAKLSQDAASQKAIEATAQADRAEQEADASLSSAKRSEQERVKADSAKSAAETARDQAAAKASDASQAAGNAYRSQQQALTSQNAAKSSETKAKASATAAANSASSMTQSVADAQAARDVALQAQSDAEDARDVASGKATLATQKANAAASSASAAADSQYAAKSSEDNAADSENKAKTSETNAKASENAANSSQAAAKASQQAASSSQQSALRSSNEAKAARDAAKTSETKAKASENNAKTSETNASSSAQKAERSNRASAASATASSESATASSESATAAKASQDEAKASETEAKASEKAAKASQSAASASQKSAQNFALIAGQNKDAAAGSAKAAKASENAAKASENAAKVSETNAADSATRAAKSSSDASANQLAAKKSQDAAKVSETSAAASKNAAAASASQASKKANQSAASATAASDSAKAAASSATAAKGSADASAGSASEAKEAETAAKKSRDEAESFAIEMRKGSVYRGTWNPNDGKYPTTPPTNSRWDVQLNNGQLEVDFDGKKWNWGDRLIYILDEKTFDIIESGTGVTSVNGNTGAVTVTPQNIGAARKTGEVFTGDVLTQGKNFSIISPYAEGTGGWARGLQAIRSDGTRIGGIGFLGGGDSLRQIRLGFGDNWWQSGLTLERDSISFNGNEVYHSGNKPTPQDVGAIPIDGGGTFKGDLLTTGYYRANNFQLNSLSTNTKYALRGSADTLAVGNGDLATVNILGTNLTHNGANVYTEKNKPTSYDIGAVAQGGGWQKYSQTYNVSKNTPATLLNREGKPLPMADKSYYIRAYTMGTGTFTGAVYYLKGTNQVGSSTGKTNLTLVAQQGSGSNHPEVFLDKDVPKLRTSHTNVYSISVIIEEADNDCNPWLDLTTAYSPINRMPWNKLKDIPTQATRWPTFSEVTGKPSKYPTDWGSVSDKPAMATRWPTWAEVGGNSYISPIDTHLQVGGAKWLRAASASTGFLPANPGTTGDSYIGTAGWWFESAYVANYYGRKLDIRGDANITGHLQTSYIRSTSNKSHNAFVSFPNAPLNSTYYFNWVSGQDIMSFQRGSTSENNQSKVNICGILTEKGSRVYSENHKPTPADIGALASDATAVNSNTLQGKSLAQVIAEARTGYATTADTYNKSEADARFFRKGQDVRIGKSGDGILSLDVGTNRDGTFYITEDSKKHGTYIRYQGSTDNWTYFGTVNSGTETDYMKVPRGYNQVYFTGNPRITAPQDMNGDSVTKMSWVLGELNKKMPTTRLDNLTKGTNNILQVNTAYGGTRIGMANPSYTHFYTDASVGFLFDKAVKVKGDIRVHDHQGTKLGEDGKIYENGKQVYSPNNKPKIAELAQPDTVTKSLKLQANIWATLLNNNNFDGSGVYQVLLTYTSAGKGGVAYSQGYTGQFYWHAENTNQDNVSEIPLQHMGTADGGEYIYLRTHAKPGNKGDHTVEIKCNRAYSAAVDFTIKLVKIM